MKTISCDDLDQAVASVTKDQGYRLDMIVPADAPREALVSRDGETVRLLQKPAHRKGTGDDKEVPYFVGASATSDSEWITGRAGMEYRDLIPGRLGGKVIASHIRLTKGGEVSDYVHYHKVEFQMIYCLAGSIRVVYEDQGEPFWLNPGDCVLQPPEIRHRVLECTAGSEVIEIGMPAVHETWVEHDIELPTSMIKPDRDFGGKRFVRHVAADDGWGANGDFEFRDTGIAAATHGFADVRVLCVNSEEALIPGPQDGSITFCFALKGHVIFLNNSRVFAAGDGFMLRHHDEARVLAGTELVYVSIKA